MAQGELDESASRTAFRTLCENWPLYAGTPVRYWLENEFVDIFGIDEVPSAETPTVCTTRWPNGSRSPPAARVR